MGRPRKTPTDEMHAHLLGITQGSASECAAARAVCCVVALLLGADTQAASTKHRCICLKGIALDWARSSSPHQIPHCMPDTGIQAYIPTVRSLIGCLLRLTQANTNTLQ